MLTNTRIYLVAGTSLVFGLMNPLFVTAQDKNAVVEEVLNEWEPRPSFDPGPVTESGKPVIELLEFSNTPLKQALNIIEDKSGRKIQSVAAIPNGRITLTLENVTAENALSIILEATDLAFEIKDDVVRIIDRAAFKTKYGYEFGSGMETRILPVLHADLNEILYKLHMLKSQDGKIFVSPRTRTFILRDSTGHLELMEKYVREHDVALQTEVFNLEYVQPREIKDQIKELLTKDLGSVNLNSRSSKIVVTDTPARLKEVAAFIKEHDHRVEIELQALVVKVALNEEHLQGIDWEAIVSNYLAMPIADQNPAEAVVPAKKTILSIGTLTADDLGVLLEALETVGQKSDVVSERIMASLNNETKIVLKRKSPDRRNQNDDFEFQLKLMTEIDDEKNLKIQLLPDMFWSIEDGAETKTRVLQLDTGTARPEVKLSSSETVVLGGLTVEEEVQTTSKVPLLGDIPILGFPFRQQNSLMQKTEYVIFLTPKIRLGDSPPGLVPVSKSTH